MKHLFLLLIFLCGFSFAHAQKDILLTINNEVIDSEEFTRVYEKNSELIKEDESNAPEDYLKLFIDYKLKVQEAYRLGLNNKKSYQDELSAYRAQLAKNYLNDVKVTEELVKEAYDRTVNELNARHILVRVSPDASPSDTLVAYRNITQARERIINGENFEKVARAISEDPSAKKNGGNLGWFKAFKMVYPFENAAYNTAINEVSKPFRTSFGYHIVQPIAARKSKGKVQVAHIMVALNQNDSTIIPEERINEVSKLLSQGASFETVALNYSDDRASYKKGGKLEEFEQGQLSSAAFEKTAFSLENIGAISQPFKTEFGWHIIKLLSKTPVPTYLDARVALTNKVTRDARAQVISNKLDSKLRNRYNVALNEGLQSYLESLFPEKYSETKIVLNNEPALSNVAFTLGKKKATYTYKMVADYLLAKYPRNKFRSRSQFVEEGIQSFVSVVLKNYHLEHLEEEDQDFADILKEYKEGLLLFDLLETNIWKKAQQDSIGLQEFFLRNKEDYRSVKTYEATVCTTKSKSLAKNYRKIISKGLSPDEAVLSLKSKSDTPVLLSNRVLTQQEFPKGQYLSIGISDLIEDGDNFIVYDVTAITEARDQLLKDVRGVVISDYQKELENKFVKNLRDKSTITINKEILNRLITKYEN
ncbi:peptidylprolyl isomerase [Dokdonia sp. 4H-3-7-5]|uniref:peptidylprolyl isomerase n=1 Tax=Dokdonia sp. (strain 4H-3-7-5) TaxID=983548 RepID=UPI00020A7735|nr:peptidylprolyl isomerase [Dokdonia sp. 4H-3-7-5]AEE20404.1 PpiC-type peptidyl-prolyl cis-trans isomerase [Dokdonia sp. 4H-3-7-5]